METENKRGTGLKCVVGNEDVAAAEREKKGMVIRRGGPNGGDRATWKEWPDVAALRSGWCRLSAPTEGKEKKGTKYVEMVGLQ